jgi:hypothetical protein
MALIARGIVSLLAFAAAFLLSYWLAFAQFLSFDVACVPAFATAAAAAIGTWRLMQAANLGILATSARWAAISGAIGFCGGFFGPMLLAPDANQGPLLGLFITGPLGFLAGGVCGLIYALWCRSPAKDVS